MTFSLLSSFEAKPPCGPSCGRREILPQIWHLRGCWQARNALEWGSCCESESSRKGLAEGCVYFRNPFILDSSPAAAAHFIRSTTVHNTHLYKTVANYSRQVFLDNSDVKKKNYASQHQRIINLLSIFYLKLSKNLDGTLQTGNRLQQPDIL